MWTLTFGNPTDIPHTTSLSGTVVFWLFGCLTIIVASRIDSYLERRRARNHARRNRMRQRTLGARLLGPHIPERGGAVYSPQLWWPSSITPRTSPPMSPGTPPFPDGLWTSSGLQTPLSDSPDRMPGDGMNAAEERERLLVGNNPGYTSQVTQRRQDRTASPRGSFNRRVPSLERRRPAERSRKARYTRPYLLDWLDEERAYLYH